jgi:anti-sigma B factor antagonist
MPRRNMNGERPDVYMEIQRVNGTLRIEGVRELSAANAQRFRDAVTAAIEPGFDVIEVDLSQTGYVDSCGLGALVWLYKLAESRNGEERAVVRLADPQPAVQQVIELTRMHHLFEIVLRNGERPVNFPLRAAAPLPAA